MIQYFGNADEEEKRYIEFIKKILTVFLSVRDNSNNGKNASSYGIYSVTSLL